MRIQQNLRDYRDELKGIAILWVVFFHAQLGLGGLVYDIQKIGYGGVDIFFFLTGFGLYHSLQKSPDIGGYAIRRAKRILPAYLPFCCLWLTVTLALLWPGAVQAVRVIAGNLLMVGFFANVPLMISWYVSALVLALVLAPFIHAALSRAKKPWRTLFVLLAGVVCIGLCFVGDDRYMAVSRLPIFILGMAFAMPKAQQAKPRKTGVLLGISFVVGLAALLLCFSRAPQLLNDYGMYWHPFVLIVPALCVGLAALFHKAQKASALFAPLRFLGRASFEIFLFNCWMELMVKRLHLANDPLTWALWSVGSIAVGALYHIVVNACMKRVNARKKTAPAATAGETQA